MTTEEKQNQNGDSPTVLSQGFHQNPNSQDLMLCISYLMLCTLSYCRNFMCSRCLPYWTELIAKNEFPLHQYLVKSLWLKEPPTYCKRQAGSFTSSLLPKMSSSVKKKKKKILPLTKLEKSKAKPFSVQTPKNKCHEF